MSTAEPFGYIFFIPLFDDVLCNSLNIFLKLSMENTNFASWDKAKEIKPVPQPKSAHILFFILNLESTIYFNLSS